MWKSDESLSCHYTTPVYLDGTLYGIDGRQEQGARLRAVDWKTGKVRWTQEGVNCGSLLAVDGQLLVLSEDGVLHLIEATPAALPGEGQGEGAGRAVPGAACPGERPALRPREQAAGVLEGDEGGTGKVNAWFRRAAPRRNQGNLAHHQSDPNTSGAGAATVSPPELGVMMARQVFSVTLGLALWTLPSPIRTFMDV